MVLHQYSTSFSARNASTPNFGGKQSSPSGFSFPIQKQGSNVFGPLQAKTTIKAPSYVATRDKLSGEIIHSISAMPAYIDKSHEQLRWETYESNKKGDPNTCPTPSIFTSPSIFNSSFTPSPSPKSIFSQSTQSFSHQPFKFNLSDPKTTNFTTNNNTISAAPVNPFSNTNLYPSQSRPSIPPPSSTPTFTQTHNPFSSNPSRVNNSDLCPKISTTQSDGKFSPSVTQPTAYLPFSNTNTISTSVNPFSPINLYPSQTQPSSIPQPTPVSSTPTIFPKSLNPSFHNNCPNISTAHTTSVTPLDSWPFTPRTSQIGQTAEKVDSVSTNDQSRPSQASNGFTKVVDVSSQTMNGQQYVPSSLVANPFATRSPIDRPNAVHGISSLPLSNNLSTTRRPTSLLRIRNVASRHPWLPSQRPSCDTKVPFFIDEVDKPGPFLPRENPRAWITNSLSLHSHSNSKGHEDNEISTGITSDTEADILATMPKLPEGGEYYTKPSVTELAAKEIAEPGWCTRVNSFVVGRKGYGSIKVFGETDVRNLHLESILQFNDREVIVYPDQEKKPPVGQSINKACEVTLLNVKCMDRKAGKQYVEGRKVERFKELLMNKCCEQGAEFVSYDPVHGEWKFRVQHF